VGEGARRGSARRSRSRATSRGAANAPARRLPSAGDGPGGAILLSAHPGRDLARGAHRPRGRSRKPGKVRGMPRTSRSRCVEARSPPTRRSPSTRARPGRPPRPETGRGRAPWSRPSPTSCRWTPDTCASTASRPTRFRRSGGRSDRVPGRAALPTPQRARGTSRSPCGRAGSADAARDDAPRDPLVIWRRAFSPTRNRRTYREASVSACARPGARDEAPVAAPSTRPLAAVDVVRPPGARTLLRQTLATFEGPRVLVTHDPVEGDDARRSDRGARGRRGDADRHSRLMRAPRAPATRPTSSA
jgi:hypothetical protein